MTDSEEIERNLEYTVFRSAAEIFEMPCFLVGKNAKSILISPGSGGHSYIFAELAYYLYRKGYNVFIMPKHGGYSVNDLIPRHIDALTHISHDYNQKIGIFGEGLGGYIVFYLALMNIPAKSIICQNSPAILTEKEYQEALLNDGGLWENSSRKRKILLPIAKTLVNWFPNFKLPISSYLDWKAIIDDDPENRILEKPLVEKGYLKDPDFDKWYPLEAIMSMVSTEPPAPISSLKIPTMFLLDLKGPTPSYIRNLYNRLPLTKKKLVEINGSVYWMLSHPKEESEIISNWFTETL
ncbi:hypothetical protein CH373_06330 [Leptospira perolatii]|uniref:Alpha/beta hydrolase n=2 Tax=Leptospira perolatii TaxID=2023191 RepID=A0A2M9ZP10_9LEPT|nr:hypothetical protein CH360_05060 [Leptospira perolatii]PJZ73774.1 hypothetical protein CH373_06330 [Leptospira perolatii]